MDQMISVEQLKLLVTGYGISLIGAIATLILGRIAAGIARSILKKIMNRAKVDQAVISFVCSLAYTAILALAVVSALAKFGVETASFVAILGAASFAVGLALQGSLSNFAAGVLILLFRPVRVGDFVEAAGVSGTVKEIQLFTTTLATPDNVKIIVPNGNLSTGIIKNFSAYDTRRIDLVIGVSYDAPIPGALSILRDILDSESRVLKDPAAVVTVQELADSSVNLLARFWVNRPDYFDVQGELKRAIKEKFDQENIEIPYPHQNVHMHQAA